MGALFGREKRQWAPEPVIPPFPGADLFGNVSVASQPDKALIVPTVWRCVTLLANSVSMLPLETFRRTGDVPRKITSPTVVATPDSTLTQSEWLHILMVSLLVRGNAFALIASRDQLLRPSQLVLLDPDKVTVRISDDGSVRYFVGPTMQDRTDDIWHVRGLTLPGKKIGLSPIAYAAEMIGLDMGARKFGKDFYDGGGVPKAVLESDQRLTKEEATEAKQALVNSTRNREPLVIGAGLKYNNITVRPDESQFLETQRFNIAQIADFFGIPAEMVGGSSGSSLTYSTVEQNSMNFLTYSVSFWLKRIEDAFFGILPDPQFTQFDVARLLRTDIETATKVDVLNVAGKIQAPSEIRTQRGLAPLTEEQATELELVPLEVNPANATPKLVPAPPTPATAADTPVVGPVPENGGQSK